MKLSRHEFIKLQREWYQKLAEQGFNDIEDLNGDELVLVQTTAHRRYVNDTLSREAKEEYFRWIAREALDEDAVYRNEVDRFILTRHAEGAKIKTIVEELEIQGMPRDRNSIRFIIRRYEMEWGLREYNCKQLHIKIKA